MMASPTSTQAMRLRADQQVSAEFLLFALTGLIAQAVDDALVSSLG